MSFPPLTTDSRGASVPPRCVLCAIGDPLIAKTMAFFLQSAGHTVTSTDNGERALALISGNSQRFHAVVIGQHVGQIMGTALVELARAMGYRGRIVIHGSEITDAERTLFQRCGADSFLPAFSSVDFMIATIMGGDSPRENR